MTNFKNPFALTRHCSYKRSSARAYNANKKSFGKKAFVSLILLLGICFNLALTALAQGAFPGAAAAGANAAGANSRSGAGAFPGAAAAGANAAGASPRSGAGAFPGAASAGANAAGASSRSGAGAFPGAVAAGANAANTNIVEQVAENDATNFTWLVSPLNWYYGSSTPDSNNVTQGIQNFWTSTGQSFFENIGSLIQQWLKQVVMFFVEPIVKGLTALMVQFAYNPDVSVGTDQFSRNVQQLALWMQFIANDLLLLFFILSIWRYWANAAWKGGSMMGSVARIIVAASATTAWPTIYHYVIVISNALTEYLISKNILNPTTISDAVAGAISSIITGQATFSFANSMLASGNLGALIFVPVVIVAQYLLVLAIGLAIMASIIVFFTMKVIQIIVVIAAFVFGPFFLCLLVSSDTDSTASGFIRAFIETSLWTFVWTVFLMLFIFALGANGSANVDGRMITQNTQNPWFILFLELGFLQAMIQTPGYLSRGKISEAGEFLELYALFRFGKGLIGGGAANYLLGPDGKISKAFRHIKRGIGRALGSDNTSMTLGGESALPTGSKQLASLNTMNSIGASVVGGKLGGLAAKSATTAALGAGAMGLASVPVRPGGTPPGQNPLLTQGLNSTRGQVPAQNPLLRQNLGQTPTTDPLAQTRTAADAAMGTGQTPISPLASAIQTASRSALGQFSTSVGGGYQGGSNMYEGGTPLVHKTSLAQLGTPGNNPWYDTRGRRTSALDCLTMYNLKHIRPGNVALTENKKNPNQNSIDFDDAGVIRKLNHRQGAGAQEVGMLGEVAALATIPYSDGKGHIDARAGTATNNAVKNAHKWDPPLARRLSYAIGKGRVPDYVRYLEKDRLEREKTKARIDGSWAYVNGERGNAYTDFLKWKFDGPMNDDTRAMLAYTSERTDAMLGGFNLNWDSGIQRLGRMGLDINPMTMGIASHEAIVAMKPSEQPQAIPAVMQLVNGYLGEMGINPLSKDFQGKDIWNASNVHWVATDGILRGLSSQHIRTARAIGDVEGISAVTPDSVNGVMALHRKNGQGEMPHAYERSVLEYYKRIPPAEQRNQARSQSNLSRPSSYQGSLRA